MLALTWLTAVPASAGTVAVVRTAVNRATAAELAAYWTPGRMAAAAPAPVPDPGAPAAPAPDGPALRVPGTSWGTALETTGRLLYSAGGRDWACTATVVAAANRSVVATARHCGFGEGGSRFRFAPGYHDGTAPHGWWDWRSAAWASGGDTITDDVAFVVLGPQDGRLVGDVVGMNGLGFNQPVDQHADIVGIPGATDAPARCRGRAYAGARGQQLMDGCAGMSGGASGGAWTVDRQPAGWAHQVGTYFGRYGSAAAGSYYGTVAHGIWQGAQADPAGSPR